MEKDKQLEALEEDWVCDIIKNTCRYYNGRRIVLWGKYGISDRIANVLENLYQIAVYGYIDSNKSQSGDGVYSVLDFFDNGDKNEYYIVIPLAFYPEISETLSKNGFEKDKDYYYFIECILEQRKDYYEDSHGNKVIGDLKGLQIVFPGFHATVIVHENFQRLGGSSKIYVRSNGVLEIGANTRMSFQTGIEIGRNAKVSIGEGCLLRSIKYMYIKPWACFEIGDKTTTWFGCCIDICEWSKVSIGEDCMLSHDIKIYSNDCHTIFDLTTGKNINSTEEICRQRNIYIGKHVWIGLGAVILYGSRIEDGSIVGAESLVKGPVPGNCIVCGSPARITRRNVAWSRKNCADDLQMETCM